MCNLVVFGLGEAGKAVIQQIKKNNNILFIIDNDQSKWNTYFEEYIVKAPSEIQQYDGDIIIASSKYAIEILEQLQDMGVQENRIYWSRKVRGGGVIKYEICPVDARKLKGTNQKLVQYDLLNREESIGKRMKVMVFCISFSVYAKQVVDNIMQRYDDVEFSILTGAKEFAEQMKLEYLEHIYCYETLSDLKTILEEIPVYDAMQLLWIEREWSYFYKFIRNKTKRLNLNVGGSDFYRASVAERNFKRKLITCADKISAEIQGTVQEFKEYYEKEVGNKMELLPFGVEVLDDIKSYRKKDCSELKRKYQIPSNKIIIICAHNAHIQNRHLELIEVLNKLPDCIKEKILCVFPMTYPDNVTEYVHEVEDKLLESNLAYTILTEFMDFQQMAGLALISDIMIRIQTTDQLSSMMLEAMYAGTVVIAGSWLPYQSLHDMGMYFLNVDRISDVPLVLSDVITNLKTHKKNCAGNSEIVWNHSSWDILAPRWHKLWE